MDKQKKIHGKIVPAIALAVLLFWCSQAFGRITTAQDAELVVTGWLAEDAKPLGITLGRQVTRVETFYGDDGEAAYHIVYLDPNGLVIVAGDDLVEPIIGFADGDTYDPSPKTPIGALVSGELSNRVKSARTAEAAQNQMQLLSISDTQRKWHHFTDLAETRANGFSFMGIGSIPDVRVAPLIQSKWSQEDVCSKPCYNYYTPNHYLSGCVATAMAQLMCYHQHPKSGVGLKYYTIEIDGDPKAVYLRGGDSYGGAYKWGDMVPVPNCSITETLRRAIGALCYDAGVSVGTHYSSDSSSADILVVREAFTKTFQYSNAITSYNKGQEIGLQLSDMVNSNLDAKYPVILGLAGSGGHAVLADGYGYNASTLYHHLNMGWSGYDDVWYNLPDVLDYKYILACVYNIYVEGTGEIISGRVTDVAGNPIEEATVVAQWSSSSRSATTDSKGIYAVVKVPSSLSYTVTVTKPGYQFNSQTVKTAVSRKSSNMTGNKWKIDFVGMVAGDWDGNNLVDLVDFATFASAWLSELQDANWNPTCDISSPPDNIIDLLDLAVFAENWLRSI